MFFPVTIAQKKWRSIRVCYTRELQKKKEVKSGSEVKARKQYVYFEQLRFLDTLCKKTSSSIDENDGEETGQDEDDHEHRELNQETIREIENPVNKGKKKKRTRQEDDELIEILKKKIVSDVENKKCDEQDGDRLFLLSLLPEIRKVLPERKLKLRSDLLATIAAAQNLPMSSSGPFAFGYQQHLSQSPYPPPFNINIPSQLSYSQHPQTTPQNQQHQQYYQQHQQQVHSPLSSVSPALSEDNTQMSDIVQW